MKLSLFLLAWLTAGCGSPILDHRVNPRPEPLRSSIKEKSTKEPSSTTLASDLPPSTCVARFQDSQLCVQINFEESPTYQASEKSFRAELRIWNSDTLEWVDILKLPVLFHQHPKQCCTPPPIVVAPLTKGRFQLSEIEFHAEGLFDFFIEVTLPNLTTDRAMVTIDVAAH